MSTTQPKVSQQAPSLQFWSLNHQCSSQTQSTLWSKVRYCLCMQVWQVESRSVSVPRGSIDCSNLRAKWCKARLMLVRKKVDSWAIDLKLYTWLSLPVGKFSWLQLLRLSTQLRAWKNLQLRRFNLSRTDWCVYLVLDACQTETGRI